MSLFDHGLAIRDRARPSAFWSESARIANSTIFEVEVLDLAVVIDLGAVGFAEHILGPINEAVRPVLDQTEMNMELFGELRHGAVAFNGG